MEETQQTTYIRFSKMSISAQKTTKNTSGSTNGSTGLTLYNKFWNEKAKGKNHIQIQRQIRRDNGIKNGFGNASHPLGCQTAMVQNKMLNDLKRMAKSGIIDDWISLVSPRETYSENKRIILREGGKRLPTHKRQYRRKQKQKLEDKAHEHARKQVQEIIRELGPRKVENFLGSNQIDNDLEREKQVLEDIKQEISKEFILSEVESQKIEENTQETKETPAKTHDSTNGKTKKHDSIQQKQLETTETTEKERNTSEKPENKPEKSGFLEVLDKILWILEVFCGKTAATLSETQKHKQIYRNIEKKDLDNDVLDGVFVDLVFVCRFLGFTLSGIEVNIKKYREKIYK